MTGMSERGAFQKKKGRELQKKHARQRSHRFASLRSFR